MNETSKLRATIRECIGNIHRELRVAITPVPKPEKWVFIVGCYNSGTTLLAEVLGKHKHISALPTEGHFLSDQLISDYEIGLPRMWTMREDLFRFTEESSGPDVKRIKKEWGMRLDTSKPVLLEKSPSNSACTRWLQANFENAHFIGIVRNGYAVAEGIRRKAEPFHRTDGWNIEECAHQWKRANEILIKDARYLENFLMVTYEDFTENTNKQLRRITDFLGIAPFGETYNSSDSWIIHERNQPIRNMNNENIKMLSGDDIQLIRRTADKILDYFNY